MGVHQRSDSARGMDASEQTYDEARRGLLVEDLNSLTPKEKKLNKIVYIFQSCLLGIAYSIIWPTVWPYTESYGEDKWMTKFYYGMTYIAYPIASMLSSFLFKKLSPNSFSFKYVLLLLNCFEMCGSLVYTLPYHACLPMVGRFLSGFGDVFYLLLAKEISLAFLERETELITMQCLSSFVVGVILAPALSLATWKVDFNLQGWKVDYLNVAGINIAGLFLIMQFLILFMLKDVSPYERCCLSTEEKKVPISSLGHSKKASTASQESTGEVMSSFYVIYVITFAFIYGFSVGSFELMLPMMYWESYPGKFIGVAAIYAFLAATYAIFLIITVTTSFKAKPRLIVAIGIFVTVAGQLLALYLKIGKSPSVLAIEVGISLALAILWAIDDVLFIDMVTFLVPVKYQDGTHTFRRAVSKVAFALSGIIIPLCYPRVVIIAPTFIFGNLALYVFFLVLSYVVSKKVFC